MKKKMLLLALASLLIVTGCEKSPKLQNGQEVVVEINGKQFTTEEFYEELKDAAGASILVNMVDGYIANQEVADSSDAETYADVQIKNLKLQYENSGESFELALINNGYENEEDFRQEIISSYKKNKVVENYFRGTITEDEIEKYYNEEIFGEITAKHILIKPETTDDMTKDEIKEAEDKALQKAKDLIKQLDEGADFATLAKENSADGSASDGGSLAPFNKQKVVKEFWDAAYKLEDGKYSSEPVLSEYGYHIILKESSAEKPSLDEVKETIYEALINKKINADENSEAIAWKEVRKKYNLNIIDTKIKNIYDSAMSNLD